MATLTLIRGLPGSGKTTTAKLFRNNSYADCHYEADSYFEDEHTGEYVFDATKLHQAHEWCKAQTRISLMNNLDVIVSNTFTTLKEMKPYIDMAQELGCTLNVIECKGNFGNVHDVPEATINKMRQRWYDFKPL